MITTDWSTIATPDGPMRVWSAVSDSGPDKGTVLVLQEAFGVNKHIRDVSRLMGTVRSPLTCFTGPVSKHSATAGTPRP